MKNHPKAAQLASILEGPLPGPQARVLVTHLLRGCSDCASTVEQILRPKRELPADAYDDAFGKAFATVQEHLAPPPSIAGSRPQPSLFAQPGLPSLPGSPT
jgi:hypothetical protein